MEISEIIKEARIKKGMTQQELADSVYVTRQAGTGRFCICYQADYFKMGAGSFPNKRILRNSPCLPACKQKNIAIKIRDTAYHKCVGISFLSL